ncbi:MAG: HAMP domain-containing sensor histidine kinase [Cetobacterium sp.]
MFLIFRKLFIIFFFISIFALTSFHILNRALFRTNVFNINEKQFFYLKKIKILDEYDSPKTIDNLGMIFKNIDVSDLQGEGKLIFLRLLEKTFKEEKIENIPLRVPSYKIIRFYDGTNMLNISIKLSEDSFLVVMMTLSSLHGYFILKKYLFLTSIIFTVSICIVLAIIFSKKILFKNGLKNSLKEAFMVGIAHDLKTPVAVISGYVESIKDGIVEKEEEIEYYKIIENQISNLDRMIGELLFYFKIESESIKIEKENLYFKEFLEKTIDRFSLDIKQVNWKFFIDDGLIYSNKKILSVLISNLLTNAFDYCDKRKEISICFENNILKISNSFEYVSENEIKKWISSKDKIDIKKTRKYGGSGIGLGIVYRCLELLKLKSKMYYCSNKKHIVFEIIFK